MNAELRLQIICLLLWLMEYSSSTTLAYAAPRMAKQGCNETCGTVHIPYPFGIGKGCYHNEFYAVTCNQTQTPYKPFLQKFSMEILSVSLEDHYMSVRDAAHHISRFRDLRGSPYTFSAKNTFVLVGCGNAVLRSLDTTVTGCTATCGNFTSTETGCFGINCCQTILSPLTSYNITFDSTNNSSCWNAFLSEFAMYTHNFSLGPSFFCNVKSTGLRLDWRIPSLGVITGFHGDYHCSLMNIDGNPDYHCQCEPTYEGNPYIPNGCIVVPECVNCKGKCVQYQKNKFYCKHSRKTRMILGSTSIGAVFILAVLSSSFWFYKAFKRRQELKHREKLFKRNGGLLLQQQISINNNSVEKTNIFGVEELEKATDNFNITRVLGQGGHGTVYKGMLADGKIVAVKKSNIVHENQIDQFINEVVILSQINHRNVVKLLGCCLETDVPLLVYEFIPKGTVFQLIHKKEEELPFSWEMRLRIATEVAGALSYLHSASSVPIYHRDIKSSNIVLDDKYGAKVADFGISKSITIDQTHLTTLVQGTFGYFDPEYFQSNRFTDKSDVYSFGVVLVELLTGQKPISKTSSQEDISLAAYFISSLEESRLSEIIDPLVLKEGGGEDITKVAHLARRCLNLKGRRRPTMKEVMVELEGIRISSLPLSVQQNAYSGQPVHEMKAAFDALISESPGSYCSQDFTCLTI